MFIRVNGIQLYYEVHGSAGRPFIFLHGNGGDRQIFQTAARLLSDRYTVYLIDSRGHGQSSPIREYHYMDMMEDVYQFIEQLGLVNPILYGFSDGGIIGLLLAIYHPDALAGLMCSGANTHPKGVYEGCYYDTLKHYQETGDSMVGMMVYEPDISTEQLQAIPIPVQIIAGEYDLILPVHTAYIAENIPDSEHYTVPGADHGSYICNNPALCDILLPFLMRHNLV